jgi:hypothetical protein
VAIPRIIAQQLVAMAVLRGTLAAVNLLHSTWTRLLSNVTASGRTSRLLKERMASAANYGEWRECAKALDKHDRTDEWRHENRCEHYDSVALQRRIDELKDLVNRKDTFSLIFKLRGAMARSAHGLLHEGLYNRAYAGTKVQVSEYHKAVCKALEAICDDEEGDEDESDDDENDEEVEKVQKQQPQQHQRPLSPGAMPSLQRSSGSNGSNDTRWSNSSMSSAGGGGGPLSPSSSSDLNSDTTNNNGYYSSSEDDSDGRGSPDPYSSRRGRRRHNSNINNISSSQDFGSSGSFFGSEEGGVGTDGGDDGVEEEEERIPTDVKLAFFNESRHAYGRTALCLSGGAALGFYHVG